MSLPKALIDTDILSAIMRKNPLVIEQARIYIVAYRKLTFSVITQYEILRGLKVKDALNQITTFNSLCNISQVILLSDEIVTRAASIYANLHQKGELISDADILIAASALTHGLAIVTNNEKHFSRIPHLYIENWLKE